MWYFQGKWYLAGVNQNCADACNSHDLECLEDEFYKHNFEIDSSGELIRVIKKLDVNLWSFLKEVDECDDGYPNGKDVPNLSTKKEFCYFGSSTRSKSTFDCNVRPAPRNLKKQRICWCQKAGYLYLFVHNIILVILFYC